MRIFWIFAAVSMFCVEMDAAPPTEKRLWDLLSATRQRRTDGSGITGCQKASEAIGQLLQLSQDTMFGSYLHYLDVFLNFDAFDPEEREAFVCQFSDLDEPSDLMNVTRDNGMLHHLYRRAYNYVTIMSMYEKQLLLEAESNEDISMSAEQIQALHLIRTVESTVLLSHDPEGADVFLEMINEDLGVNFIQNYTAEPLSDEPLPAQVNKLTNALRKVWNQHVRQMSEWNPDYSQELRQTIHEWTGITIGQHNQMKSIVQDLLESANDGLLGIELFVERTGVVFHALEKGYPLLVDSVNYLIYDLEHSLNYYYSYNDIYDSEAYMDYQDIMNQINENLLMLLEGLGEMGLFSL